MKISLIRLFVVAGMFAVLTVVAEVPVLKVWDVWSRATPPGAANGGVFMKIENAAGTDDHLLKAGTDRARAVELHAHRMDGGIARMIAMPDIEVPAGQVVDLKPGGMHVMLIGLARPLAEGERFSLTLHFEKAGIRVVEVKVLGAGGMAAEHAGHGNRH